MKKLSQPHTLCVICAGAGILCLVMRLWLLHTGADEKGLLTTGHPGSVASWALAIGIVVLLMAALWGRKERCIFPPQKLNALGMLLSAVGFLAAAVKALSNATNLSRAAGILAVLAALCALFMAWNRSQGRRTHVLLSLPSVICFLLLLLNRYQSWSAEPELQRYVWPLTALVCVMLATYQNIASQLGMGSSFKYLLFGCGGVFFCFGAAAGPESSLFFLAMGIWLLLDIRTLVLKRTRKGQGE